MGSHIPKIKLVILGEDENAKPTKFRQNITNFTRKESHELLDPVVVDVDEQTRYVKLNLYYGDDLLEDYYIRIPKLFVRRVFDNIGSSTETHTQVKDQISKVKQEILSKYTKAKNERNSKNLKGKLLEQVIVTIISLVPELEVADSDINNGIQEIDVVVRNHNRTGIWADVDGVFFIECKNWLTKIGAAEVRDFKGKLDNKGIKFGIFVAPNGITGRSKLYGANGQIDKFLQGGVKIIILQDEDIYEILNCKDISVKIDEKFLELYTH